MRQSPLLTTALLVAAIPGMLAAQMNLANISSRSLWDGRTVRTIVDTLDMNTEVGYGQAKTVVTLTLRPEFQLNCVSKPVYDSLGRLIDNNYTCAIGSQRVDSIEMALSFALPTDFVASAMTLWVGDSAVPAQIQDRSLASEQYAQITRVQRKDPALLEFWGNGSYNLRIFPTSSGHARKIAMEFRHTFDDDSAGLITACLPFIYDTAHAINYYYGYRFEAPLAGLVRLSCRSIDGATYSISAPGLGSGVCGPNRILQLSGRSVGYLGATSISTADPSAANEYAWRAVDARTGAVNAGMALQLDPGMVRFDDEPDTRIIAIDIRNAVWNWADYYRDYYAYYGYGAYSSQGEAVDIWQRAQKFAVLALRSYLAPDRKFNVVIGGPSVKTVFGAPVAATEENLQKATREILAALPSDKSSTLEVLRSALLQAPQGVIITLSDLYMPYNYYANPKKGDYTLSAAGLAYEAILEDIRSLTEACEATLFDISDNWDINSASVATGGFRIGSLLSEYGIAYEYRVVDGKRIMSLKMPPLFGSYNPLGVKITSIDMAGMSGIVYSNDWEGSYVWWPQPYYGQGRGDIIMFKQRALAKMVLPHDSYGEQAMVRIAGKLSGAGALPFVINGKMSGLRFTYKGTAVAAGDAAAGDVQYAFRTTEWLAARDLGRNASAIKKIGKDYHIVTRQTSLLALEPGMKMWEDTIAQQPPTGPLAGAEGATLKPAFAADAALYSTSRVAAPSSSSSGVNIDDVSLESLISGLMAVNGKLPGAQRGSISVTTVKGSLVFSIPSGFGRMTVRLYDAAGRVVAAAAIPAADAAKGSFAWAPITGRCGFFVLRIDGEGFSQRQRVLLDR